MPARVGGPTPSEPATELRRDVVARALRAHWPLALVLAAGAGLRAVVMVAYTPLFWFTDTDAYLHFANVVQPSPARQWGYSGFLWLVLPGLGHREIVALQHALTLVFLAFIYAFLVRRRVTPWLAALAVVPLALSPLYVNVEHHLLSDWLFVLLSVSAAMLVAWADTRPALSACVGAGLLTAAAIWTRQLALVGLPLLFFYLLARRAGWARIAAFVVAAVLPAVGFLVWMHQTYGVYGFSTWSGRFLYARVAPIAQCDRLGDLTPQERTLCDRRPLDERPGPDGYIWSGPLPLGQERQPNLPARNVPDRVAGSFARKVLVHQPVDYARMIGREIAEMFYPGRKQRLQEACAAYWTFPYPRPGGCRTDAVGTRLWRKHPFAAHAPFARWLNAYQRFDYPIGPAFLGCLLVTAFAFIWRPRAGGWRTRLDAALLALLGFGLVAVAFATATFSYRYTLPLYATVAPAAGLALVHLAVLRRAGAEEAVT